ncbi:MAG: hypothetical protein EXS13_00750 [Planctomycetes bacterium]|nr:hypothetical protein [Planctomycetota bacterium]
MSGCLAVWTLLVALVAAQDGAARAEFAALRGPGRSVALGETIELDLAVESAPGATLRLAGSFALDPAFVVEERRSSAAGDEDRTAHLTLVVRACGPGRFELGPFTVALTDPDGRERPLKSETLTLEIVPPWPPGAPPPPFTEWRRASSERSEPSISGRVPFVVLGIASLLLVGAWMTWRRRAMSPRGAAPRARGDRSLLARPLPDDLGARRRHCAALQAWLRAELAARFDATGFAWTREELITDVAAPWWSAVDREALAELLAELESSIYSRFGASAARTDIGSRLATLLPESPS